MRWAATLAAIIPWLFAATTGAQEIFSDGFDDASICAWSNADQTDSDNDGYKVCAFDCVDNDGAINPGATDVCGDGVDSDCTGFADESCCHPLQQNCGGAEACYYDFINHSYACATPFGNPPGQQGDACMFVNGCDQGFGCTLCIPPGCNQGELVCAAFCDPNGSDCATGETCLLYNQYWGNVDPVPDDFGMCVPNEIIP
jgi:Putative metal-binding motif